MYTVQNHKKSGTVNFFVLNIAIIILGICYKDIPQIMYVDRRRNGNCYYLQQIKIKKLRCLQLPRIYAFVLSLAVPNRV